MKDHGMIIIIKSVITPELPRAQVTGTILIHFNPGGRTDDTVTGMHCNSKTRKKLIIQEITRPITIQLTTEKTSPRNILLYRKSMLHFATPNGRTWKVVYVKCA